MTIQNTKNRSHFIPVQKCNDETNDKIVSLRQTNTYKITSVETLTTSAFLLALAGLSVAYINNLLSEFVSILLLGAITGLFIPKKFYQ